MNGRNEDWNRSNPDNVMLSVAKHLQYDMRDSSVA